MVKLLIDYGADFDLLDEVSWVVHDVDCVLLVMLSSRLFWFLLYPRMGSRRSYWLIGAAAAALECFGRPGPEPQLLMRSVHPPSTIHFLPVRELLFVSFGLGLILCGFSVSRTPG